MIPFAALDAAVALLKRYKVLILVLPLLMALGVQSCRLKSAKADLSEKQAIISNMELASKMARDKQIALNQTNQDLSQRIAANAKTLHVQLADANRRAVADYASTRRVQNYCRGSGTNQAAVPSDPGSPDSPDADEVLAVPRSDFEALANDAMRGAESRSFLIEQVNEGLAVVLPD
jgi:hypothetical protein